MVRAFLLVAVTSLTGCIGVGYSAYERRVEIRPRSLRVLSADDLLARWGEPDERTWAEDGTEGWTYDRSFRWAYVYVCIGVCVPLGVPVGWTSDTFRLRDGVVESVERVRSVEISHLCGFLGGVCPSWGCSSTRR